MRRTRRAVMAISATTLALPALAQIPWPSRTIRFIVPFAAGGPVEVPARFLADHLGRALGQPVPAETRPGAGGSPGP